MTCGVQCTWVLPLHETKCLAQKRRGERDECRTERSEASRLAAATRKILQRCCRPGVTKRHHPHQVTGVELFSFEIDCTSASFSDQHAVGFKTIAN